MKLSSRGARGTHSMVLLYEKLPPLPPIGCDLFYVKGISKILFVRFGSKIRDFWIESCVSLKCVTFLNKHAFILLCTRLDEFSVSEDLSCRDTSGWVTGYGFRQTFFLTVVSIPAVVQKTCYELSLNGGKRKRPKEASESYGILLKGKQKNR
jgi:hypothetical protein